MTTSFTSDDLQALLKFPFDDPGWTNKLLIGSLLLFAGYVVPIIPIVFVYGYYAQIERRIIVEGGEPSLPEWDDWGRFFSDGLKLTGVIVVYMLPLIVFFCAGYGIFVGLIFGPEAAMRAAPDPESISPLMTFLPFLGMLIWLVLFALGMIGLLAVGLILPVATSHVIATGQFAAGFRISEWWPIFRANLAGYLISFILILGVWMALSFAVQVLYLTVILCCLVPFILAPLSMYIMIIGSVLFGQAYRTGVDKVSLLNSI
jgi:hypothetical protein